MILTMLDIVHAPEDTGKKSKLLDAETGLFKDANFMTTCKNIFILLFGIFDIKCK